MINKFAALVLIGMASPYQILDWYGGRHTCHTASGALENSLRGGGGESSRVKSSRGETAKERKNHNLDNLHAT